MNLPLLLLSIVAIALGGGLIGCVITRCHYERRIARLQREQARRWAHPPTTGTGDCAWGHPASPNGKVISTVEWLHRKPQSAGAFALPAASKKKSPSAATFALSAKAKIRTAIASGPRRCGNTPPRTK